MIRILLLLLIPALTYSQVKTTTRKVVQLIEPRQIFVNSATKLNGKTRVDIKIDLPRNTVEWFYSFSTTPAPAKNNLDLLAQISRIYDPTGLTASTLTSLSVPDGSAPIDVFLIDETGRSHFHEKDVWGQHIYTDPGSFSEGTTKNTRQGKVKIDDIKRGTYYLGIRNPSMNTGVNVMIEVVAIIEVTDYDNSKWSKETKNYLFDSLKKLIVGEYSETIVDEFCGCVIDKLTSEYTIEAFNELAEYEKKRIYLNVTKECNTNNKINLKY